MTGILPTLAEKAGLLGIFLVVVMIHEFGHLIAFHHFLKRWQPLRVRWWGLEVGSKEENKELTLRQDYWVRYWGIAAGWVALLIMLPFSQFLDQAMFYSLIYMIMCFFDFCAITTILSNPDKRDWKYKEMKLTRVIEP